jgi:hypothetical protein
MSKYFKTNNLIFFPKTNHTVKNGFFICITDFFNIGRGQLILSADYYLGDQRLSKFVSSTLSYHEQIPLALPMRHTGL